MKRVGGLWDNLVSYSNLYEALRRAASGKRKRPDVAAFLMDQEIELVLLRQELISGSYKPGPYREFQIVDPKPRMISAAPFRDRVVHSSGKRSPAGCQNNPVCWQRYNQSAVERAADAVRWARAHSAAFFQIDS